MPSPRRMTGFTLVEMIGVLAIIGILAAVATPRIFDAIRDSKISGFVQSAATVRTAVATYYRDTGALPIHNAKSANANQHQLMRLGTAVAGWKGPYLNEEMVNPFNGAGNFLVNRSTAAAQQFDLDGNGAADTTGQTAYIQVDRLTYEQARRISDVYDKDYASTAAGNTAWYRAGRVKTNGGTAPATTSTNVTLLIHIASN
ncbi:MAG: type II secretion system protein [Gammaproteobacteria bacterium]